MTDGWTLEHVRIETAIATGAMYKFVSGRCGFLTIDVSVCPPGEGGGGP